MQVVRIDVTGTRAKDKGLFGLFLSEAIRIVRTRHACMDFWARQRKRMDEDKGFVWKHLYENKLCLRIKIGRLDRSAMPHEEGRKEGLNHGSCCTSGSEARELTISVGWSAHSQFEEPPVLAMLLGYAETLGFWKFFSIINSTNNFLISGAWSCRLRLGWMLTVCLRTQNEASHFCCHLGKLHLSMTVLRGFDTSFHGAKATDLRCRGWVWWAASR
jgi:hypothetical protein